MKFFKDCLVRFFRDYCKYDDDKLPNLKEKEKFDLFYCLIRALRIVKFRESLEEQRTTLLYIYKKFEKRLRLLTGDRLVHPTLTTEPEADPPFMI